MRVLFVAWDGPGLNYLQSLFLPIFEGLRPLGYHFDVLQFRWGPVREQEAAEAACAAAGVGYRAAAVSRRAGAFGPFATAMAGGRQIRRAAAFFDSELLMPRSVLPALATLASRATGGLPAIYDSDGLEVDERVEFAGLAPTGAAYRILRDAEAQMIRRSRAVLVRTDVAAQVLHARAGAPVGAERFFVVANGRDPARFHPHNPAERARTRAELGISADAPLVAYAGSVGPAYRFADMAAFVRELRRLRPDARLLVLSGSPERATAELAAAGGNLGGATVRRVDPAAVPRYLAAADLGLAYRRPAFSTRAVSPIKLGEYLLCGLPVLGTAVVGNTAGALQAGVLFDAEAGPAPAAAWFASKVLPARDVIRARAREEGLTTFSLQRSITDYARALSAVAS